MEYSFFNWVDKVKRFYPFSRKELMWIGVGILVMTFIYGFDDGKKTFEAASYATNMLIGLVTITIAVIIHESAHRIAGAYLGYKVEFKPFFFGLLGGLILSFMSYGKIVFLAYGSFLLNFSEKHRLGYFRYRLGYFDNGKIALFGPLANLAAAMAFKSMTFLPEPLYSKLVFINVMFAIMNTLPIPPLDGAHIMYATKTFFPLVIAAIIGAAALLLLPIPIWLSLLGALGIGAAFTFFYVIVIEGKVFQDWG